MLLDLVIGDPPGRNAGQTMAGTLGAALLVLAGLSMVALR